MKPLNILALDPATKTGFAHSSGISGTWDLSVRRDESTGMRLIRLRSKLNEVLKAFPIDLLVYEGARHAAPQMQGALIVQTEFQSVIKVWCIDSGIEFRAFSPSEVKKWATGKGNAKKDMMIAAARLKWAETKIVDDNHADALFMLDMTICEYSETGK